MIPKYLLPVDCSGPVYGMQLHSRVFVFLVQVGHKLTQSPASAFGMITGICPHAQITLCFSFMVISGIKMIWTWEGLMVGWDSFYQGCHY